jgi:hypothetical protein
MAWGQSTKSKMESAVFGRYDTAGWTKCKLQLTLFDHSRQASLEAWVKGIVDNLNEARILDYDGETVLQFRAHSTDTSPKWRVRIEVIRPET